MSASERRGAARTSIVWESLQGILGSDSDVLDIGGGTGGFAVRVAELGHRVRVIDPSPDALAALSRRAQEGDVADRVTGQQGDISTLLEAVGPESVDVVLCHGVLEVVDDPASALATLAQVLRPGGTLSVLANQRHAAVVARAIAGHFGQAREILDGAAVGRSGHRFTSDEITGLLDGAGLRVTSIHGIRVFADLVPGSLLDLEPGATQALLDLERAVATRSEYLPLATQVHVLATR
ncbi:methyltransferase [Nocardioides sp. AE5]|uniref:methyltransferase n=1 Tax=Nocardioides sp. AE5 TaxID=2962573 RepID=UPI00288176E8|nr:methyltransferase [Nocardioides sp. AE5]MDT0201242.1 methyltransferase [Nocardioides sp. AE5]